MEKKKTIGTLIATLRKEKGLTQKQLAERLRVSDKTVSRWEREESLPDLSLVPALAEMLGITVEELLRGERITSEEQPKEKTKRVPGAHQLRRIEKATKTNYLMCCLRSITISAVAIPVVLGCVEGIVFGHGIDRFSLALALAVTLQLLALAHQTGGTIRSMSSLGEDELPEVSLTGLRRHLVKRGMLTYSIQLELTVFSILCLGSWSLVEWFALGAIWLGATAVVCLILCGILWGRLSNKGKI